MHAAELLHDHCRAQPNRGHFLHDGGRSETDRDQRDPNKAHPVHGRVHCNEPGIEIEVVPDHARVHHAREHRLHGGGRPAPARDDNVPGRGNPVHGRAEHDREHMEYDREGAVPGDGDPAIGRYFLDRGAFRRCWTATQIQGTRLWKNWRMSKNGPLISAPGGGHPVCGRAEHDCERNEPDRGRVASGGGGPKLGRDFLGQGYVSPTVDILADSG